MERAGISAYTFTYTDPEGVDIHVYRWLPDADTTLRGIVQIAHGMAETAARYARFAERLTAAGFAVYANDHRGHGRTAGKTENIGYLGSDGFNRMADNVSQLTAIIMEAHPALPVFLFGHSMGSFVTQKVMYTHPGPYAGIVLSGSNGKRGADLHIGKRIARWEAARKGDRHRSELMNGLSFGGFNRAFRPARTEFDWLSRDEAEVDAYIADPYCGGVFTSSFFRDFLHGLADIHRPGNMQRIPRDLPVLLVSGDRDPVGRFGKGVLSLAAAYRKLGMTHIECRLYPGGRHELLNETNREEVMRDVIGWLEKRLQAPGR
ncbi:lysophospholipase [Paenibacillus sp. MBLB4367]|uniref:alpha/beta hydrolase n=1 Tax=Paenibacillus sp. MBLB4367 TaxID=3384767 RepID=UPI003907FA6F